MSSVIQNLLDNIVGEGARSSKFECFINFADPNLIATEREIFALVKTSQFPGKTNDIIDIKFKGRNIPVKGQVKYDNTWTCTFYLTQDHELKKSLEDWIESLDQQHNFKKTSDEVFLAQKKNSEEGYTSTLRIAQMDFSGTNETVVYDLYHAFPKSVSSVDVDYSSTGTITEFTVEFSYVYFESQIVKSQFSTITEALKNEIKNNLSELSTNIKTQVSSAFNNIIGKPLDESYSGINSSVKEKISGKSNMASKIEW